MTIEKLSWTFVCYQVLINHVLIRREKEETSCSKRPKNELTKTEAVRRWCVLPTALKDLLSVSRLICHSVSVSYLISHFMSVSFSCLFLISHRFLHLRRCRKEVPSFGDEPSRRLTQAFWRSPFHNNLLHTFCVQDHSARHRFLCGNILWFE